MLLLPLLVLALWQDPVPEQPAPEQPVPEQPSVQDPVPEQAEPQDPKTVTMQEVEAKLAQVTETYADADRTLTRSVDNPNTLLAEAAAVAKRLVKEMEELLAVLPEPPPPPPNDSKNPPPPNEQAKDQPPKQERPEDQAQPTPLRDMPLSEFLRDPRDGTWGKLPPRLQQTIDNASAEDVPLRYRRWLVEYHRQGIRNNK